jgi:hypothetical protein
MAVKQQRTKVKPVEVAPDCDEKRKEKGWDECQCAQVCEMVNAYNKSKRAKKRLATSPSNAEPGTTARKAYDASLKNFASDFAALVEKHAGNPDHPAIKKMFYSPPAGKPPPPAEDCVHAAWKKQGAKAWPKRGSDGGFSPDHMHPAGLNGALAVSNMKWADGEVNGTVGGGMDIKPAPKKMKAHSSCNC